MSPRAGLGLLLCFTALAGALATRTRVSTNLLDALPSSGGFADAYADAQRFALLDTVIVDVDGATNPAALHEAVDTLGTRLSTHPELFDVRYRVGLEDGIAIRNAAMPHVLTLLPADDLAQRLSPQGLQSAMDAAAAKLSGLSGPLVARMLPSDPLDFGSAFTTRMQLAPVGEGVRLVSGHFVDETETHALILLRTKQSAFGTSKASPLYTTIEADLAASPLPARWLGSAKYAAEARDTIIHETGIAIGAGVLLVALVFLVAFRSVRPLLGTLPAAILGTALAGAAAALCSPVHGLTLAFGGALAGLGVDYWIHLYLHSIKDGVAGAFSARYAQAQASLRTLLGAYGVSIAATATSFLMLATSSYPAVADLGIIGVGGAIGALLSVALAGPLVFAMIARPGDTVPRLPIPERIPGRWGGLATLSVLALGVLAVGVKFDGDPRAMDARLPATAALEAELNDRWSGGGTAALVVAEGESVGAALDRLQPAVAALHAGAPGVRIQSPLGFLPAPRETAARQGAALDVARIEADFIVAAEAAGFEPAGLLPGLRATLAASSTPNLRTWAATPLADVLSRTVRIDDNGHATVAAILRAITPEALDHASYEVELSGADVRFVHPAGLTELGANRIREELLTRSGGALLLVLLYLGLRFRDAAKVVAAAAPSVAAIAGTLGSMALLGQPLTPASGPALVLVLGLAFDQGIFLVEGEAGGRNTFLAARAAIVVALGNAGAGFAGLLFATHPAVHGVGLVVTLGIAWTAVGAFLITPTMLGERGEASTRSWLRRSALALLTFVVFDQIVAYAGRVTPPAARLENRYPLEELSPTERRFGPNRVVRRHGMWVARVEGTPEQIGQAGATMSAGIQRRAEASLYSTFTRLVPNRFVQYGLARGLPFLGRAIVADSPPEYLQELAAYTQIGEDPWWWLTPVYTRKLMMHALHDVGQAMVGTPLLDGCTGFVAGGDWTPDQHWLLARNWDFGGGAPFSEDKAIVAIRRDGAIPFMHVAMLGLAGSVSGVNEAGIGIALQAAASDSPVRPGAPMIFIAREVLENARSLDDVQRILEGRRGFVSEAVLAVDGEHGEAAIFEVTPTDVDRIDAGTHLAQANHLRGRHAGDGTNTSRMAHGTTVQRLDRMQALLDAGPVDIPRAISMLRDRGEGLADGDERAINADIAAHGVVIDATARTITVGAWPNVAGVFVRFSLADLLAGRMDGEVMAGPDDPERSLRVHLAKDLGVWKAGP